MNSQIGGSTESVGDASDRVSPTADFGVSENWFGRNVVVAVSGDVDIATAPALAEAIHAATRRGPAALIIDLSRVDFLASAGMSLLISTHRDIAPSARFGVVADGPSTSRPLKMIGIDKIFDVFPTLDEAFGELA